MSFHKTLSMQTLFFMVVYHREKTGIIYEYNICGVVGAHGRSAGGTVIRTPGPTRKFSFIHSGC